jgi:hypothetical protein
MDNFFDLLLFVMFLGALFAGGFYVGYRYRDNLSLERKKRHRHSRTREASRSPVLLGADRTEVPD